MSIYTREGERDSFTGTCLHLLLKNIACKSLSREPPSVRRDWHQGGGASGLRAETCGHGCLGGFRRACCSRAWAVEMRLEGAGRMDLGRRRWRTEGPWRLLQQSWREAVESRDGGGQAGRTPAGKMWSRR